jgi:chemotaxis protein methyltransferase CheR
MLLADIEPQLQFWDVKLLATDIDQKVLQHAEAGSYSQYEVQRGLPILYLTRYFTKSGDAWNVNPVIRKRIQFKPFNLLGDLSGLGTFDAIFCRNVLIYFDVLTKKKILEQMSRMLSENGVLFLGSTESSIGITDALERVFVEKGHYYRRS